jgi:hypothetical protein
LFASEEIGMSRALKQHGRFVVVREGVTTSGRKMRMYSAGEMLRIFVSIILSGRKALERREGLDLWYGDHRDDPELALE